MTQREAGVSDFAAEGDVNSSAARKAWSAAQDQETRAALAEDETYFLRQSLSTPCLGAIKEAHGAELITVSGLRLLDFHGNSVHQVGHGHPKVVAAIKAQLDELPFSPRRYANAPATELARRLVHLAPDPLTKVLFAPSGAAAVSMAMKLARLATGRHKMLSMWDSFHGANLDTISIGGEPLFRRGVGPLLPGTEHIPPFDQAQRFFGDDGRAFERLADYIDYVLALEGDVAALIAEPMRWTAVVAPPLDFWPRVRESCDRCGTLLIFDEIPSCLARTGKMFACQHFGAAPDILAIGKGLGGGIMPMAAILARPELDVAADAALGHYTHEKSPVGAAAGLATLDVIEDERLCERARELEQCGRGRLNGIAERLSFFGEIRSLGCYFGVEVAGNGAAEKSARAEAILYDCLSGGLSFKIGGGTVLTLCPPLTIEIEAFERAFDILAAAIEAVETR